MQAPPQRGFAHAVYAQAKAICRWPRRRKKHDPVEAPPAREVLRRTTASGDAQVMIALLWRILDAGQPANRRRQLTGPVDGRHGRRPAICRSAPAFPEGLPRAPEALGASGEMYGTWANCAFTSAASHRGGMR